MKRIDLLTAAQLKRLDEAWLDPEVTVQGCAERFQLSSSDMAVLRKKHGPKARPSATCRVDGGKPHRLLGNGWAT